MTRIIFVRHGWTDWNRIERFRGRIDVPLNTIGLKQANQTGQWICAHWTAMAIYSSLLYRAIVTANAIAQNCNLTVQPHNESNYRMNYVPRCSGICQRVNMSPRYSLDLW